ncbi:hypothetical protein PROFUN_06213 [Planoprotostelium fungivorum]|uniref:Uncharacterized protein n=1 Tax=Planoprotostelium fungivorum TaxID=1890364 RepID=A0A2P6MYZ8_9EUKA|nr:hypothetical protein PROFUN_06213 [Planoprotostelium fungivorum]
MKLVPIRLKNQNAKLRAKNAEFQIATLAAEDGSSCDDSDLRRSTLTAASYLFLWVIKTTTMDTAPPDTIIAIQEHLDFFCIRQLMSTCRRLFTILEPLYWSRLKFTVHTYDSCMSWLYNKKELARHVRELCIKVHEYPDDPSAFHECLSRFINVDKIKLELAVWYGLHQLFGALKCKPREVHLHITYKDWEIEQVNQEALRELLQRGVRSIHIEYEGQIDFITEEDLQQVESIFISHTNGSLLTYRLPNLKKIQLREHFDRFNAFAAINPQITHVIIQYGILPPLGDLLPNLQHLEGAAHYDAMLPMSDGRFRTMKTFSIHQNAIPPPPSAWAAQSQLWSLSMVYPLPDWSHLPPNLTHLSVQTSHDEVDKILSQAANLQHLAHHSTAENRYAHRYLPTPGTRLEQFYEIRSVSRWLNHPNCPSTIWASVERGQSVHFSRDGFYWFDYPLTRRKWRWMICRLQGDRWVEAKTGSVWILDEEQWKRGEMLRRLGCELKSGQ